MSSVFVTSQSRCFFHCLREQIRQVENRLKACFPIDEFVRTNREKSNLIGWRQTLTISPANHIRFLLVRAKKIAKWKTGLTQWRKFRWGGGAIAPPPPPHLSSNCQFVGNFHFIGSSETHELFYKTVIISKFPTN